MVEGQFFPAERKLMNKITSPETLVAILLAARRSGDRELERQAQATLKTEFGITLKFEIEHVAEGVKS